MGATDEREPDEESTVIRHRWEHHQVSGLRGFGGFDCSCSPASFPGNHQYHAHRRRAFFVEANGEDGAIHISLVPESGWTHPMARVTLSRPGFPPLARAGEQRIRRAGEPLWTV